MPRKISFTLHFWHKPSSSSAASSSSRIPSDRCAAQWPTAISDLHSVYPPESCWARRSEGDRAVFSSWPFSFVGIHPPSDAEHHVLWLHGPGVQLGQTEISVDDVRCHLVLINHRWSTSALETWAHQHTSIADTSCGKPPVNLISRLRPRGSICFCTLEQNRPYQCLVYTGVLWCWYWDYCNSIPSVENSSLNRQVQSCVEHPVGIRTLLTAKVRWTPLLL